MVGRADYNEWGQITHKDALDITSSYRRIYPQLSYTGHDWDDVLGMYYAKARFYDADTKRFVAIDPVKGNITEPLSLVSYIYCVDNPLRWVDPLGLRYENGGSNKLGASDSKQPQTAQNSSTTWATVTGDVVRFRSNHNLDRHNILFTLTAGTKVEYLGHGPVEDGYEWARVRYNGQVGWMAETFLRHEERKNSTISNPAPAATAKDPVAAPSVAPAPTPTLPYQIAQNLHPNNPDGTARIPTNPNDPYIVQKGAVHPNMGPQETLQCSATTFDPYYHSFGEWWDDFSGDIAGIPSAIIETELYWDEYARTAEHGLIDVAYGGVNFFTLGIVDNVWQGIKIRNDKMLEDPSLFNITNFFSLGIVETFDRALEPQKYGEKFFSFEHLTSFASSIAIAAAAGEAIQSASVRPNTTEALQKYARENYNLGQTAVTGISTVDSFIESSVPEGFRQAVREAFEPDVQVVTLTDDLVVYRYYGGTSAPSSFWYTPYLYDDPISVLSLPPGNTAEFVSTSVIPKGTTVLQGHVAPMFNHPGQGFQIYVADPSVIAP